MKVELYTMAYNEEWLMPYFIHHYRKLIPDIEIYVYDNESTDRTAEIARDLGCVVRTISTGGEIRDDLLTDFKNNVWKGTEADWFIICDVDEWVDIDLFYLRGHGPSYYMSEGYDMIGGVDTDYGVRNPLYDKICVWNAHQIDETNYGPGAHQAFPERRGAKGTHRPKLYHMRYLDKQWLIDRYKQLGSRLSHFNAENGYAHQYLVDAELISKHYDDIDKAKIKIK